MRRTAGGLLQAVMAVAVCNAQSSALVDGLSQYPNGTVEESRQKPRRAMNELVPQEQHVFIRSDQVKGSDCRIVAVWNADPTTWIPAAFVLKPGPRELEDERLKRACRRTEIWESVWIWSKVTPPYAGHAQMLLACPESPQRTQSDFQIHDLGNGLADCDRAVGGLRRLSMDGSQIWGIRKCGCADDALHGARIAGILFPVDRAGCTKSEHSQKVISNASPMEDCGGRCAARGQQRSHGCNRSTTAMQRAVVMSRFRWQFL
jgi:hypothetical protein